MVRHEKPEFAYDQLSVKFRGACLAAAHGHDRAVQIVRGDETIHRAALILCLAARFVEPGEMPASPGFVILVCGNGNALEIFNIRSETIRVPRIQAADEAARGEAFTPKLQIIPLPGENRIFNFGKAAAYRSRMTNHAPFLQSVRSRLNPCKMRNFL